MAFEIVDGMTGTKHISSDDLSALNVATIGKADCVLKYGDDFKLTMASANSATLGTGVGMVGGKRFWNQAATSLTIQSGTQGQKRNDLVRDGVAGPKTLEKLFALSAAKPTASPTQKLPSAQDPTIIIATNKTLRQGDISDAVKAMQQSMPHAVGMAAASAVHFQLPVSLRTVHSVVEQGQCISENSTVLTAVVHVQPLRHSSARSAAGSSRPVRLPCDR